MVAKDVLDRLKEETAPAWFRDAKLGVFVHWGLFSVPAWAPLLEPGRTMVDLLRQDPRNLGAQLPYAEWYLNALAIPDSPTARHHRATYGDAPYEAFREPFEAGLSDWDPEAWADLFAASGATYVVMVTKHHDGYCLWPTEVVHPTRPGWHAPRDLVGELAAAVRARGLRFGVYYSAGLDWSVFHEPIRQPVDIAACTPRGHDYARYATEQLDELVDRYAPSIVWGDMGAPPDLDLAGFLVRYLERVPDGTINERWNRPLPGSGGVHTRKALNALAARLLPRLPERPTYPGNHPLGQFRTPEYSWPDRVVPHPWETTRGMGTAFGHNRQEPASALIDPAALLWDLIDIVAKGGNLLVNVGPLAGGSVPEPEAQRLHHLGRWLDGHGEAMFGTRPWIHHAAATDDGIAVRFTQRDGDLFAIGARAPSAGAMVVIPELAAGRRAAATLLGGTPVAVALEPGETVRFRWPEAADDGPWVLRVAPSARSARPSVATRAPHGADGRG